MGTISQSPRSKRGRNLVSWLQRDIRLLAPLYGAERAEQMARGIALLESLIDIIDTSETTGADLFGDPEDTLPAVVLFRTRDDKMIDHEFIGYGATKAEKRAAIAARALRNMPLLRRLSSQMSRVGHSYSTWDISFRRANPSKARTPKRTTKKATRAPSKARRTTPARRRR